MKIGEVAKLTGLSVKSIRYYHDINLVHGVKGENGYREYDTPQVNSLKFIHHCRELGFSLDDCRSLLDLKLDNLRDAEEVKALAREHLQEISQRIIKLQTLETQLSQLVKDCRGGAQPDCAILTGLSCSTTTN
ncbi:MerR family transcriptional regulator [Shewanella hanedai]|jgi:Cu(I)-responsive transcriptional regulator|uniref:HTH-type transcriptional regulator CueR n=1 Tax=Shewanella hanedai TaxID=25 RepID=A0A553JPT9_SHEHA|nr:MerR family DNA-binding protein [Shewanella hanedai]TRY14494.1 MerR family transcriptional regulator [Shewanella hanedai]GGI78519.1 MerR family transcriptional regulator [Shewanella hanedai]